MNPRIPKTVSRVKYWKYYPERGERTRPRDTRNQRVIGKIKSALAERMNELEYFAEDPSEPRYVVLMYLGNRRRLGLKVMGNLVVLDDQCYESKNENLFHVLEALPKSAIEKIASCGPPRFTK